MPILYSIFAKTRVTGTHKTIYLFDFAVFANKFSFLPPILNKMSRKLFHYQQQFFKYHHLQTFKSKFFLLFHAHGKGL